IAAISVLCLSEPAVAAGGEAGAVVRVIEESARAMSELPKSRDRQSVLRFYTADYRGITDGQWQTRENLDSVVSEIDENVKLGNPVRITNRATKVEASAIGPVGWATYDFYSKIEVLGEVLGEVERRCTGVYRKEDAGWRIRHEHCSTSWAASPTDEPQEEPPAEERVPG
ncbi:MAG: nuclear transport factor 2 family protein, partial [Candidatus Binatia bacterium]